MAERIRVFSSGPTTKSRSWKMEDVAGKDKVLELKRYGQ